MVERSGDGGAAGAEGARVAAPVPPVAHAPAARGPGALPVLVATEVSRLERTFYGVVAGLLVAGFAVMAAVFYVPAHAGVDQNGYLVGGRQIYQTGKLKLAPRMPGSDSEFDAHQFVGGMWVGVDYGQPTERFYPKYPIGLSLLYAAALAIGGTTSEGAFPGWGVYLAFWISPVCMTLAMVATYKLLRLVAEPFLAIVGAVLVATSPTTLQLTNNPNSHASGLCCVAWGMYLLLRWWQVQGWWRGFLGAFLLGFAATIRYSEATLVIPVLLVVGFYLYGWLRAGREGAEVSGGAAMGGHAETSEGPRAAGAEILRSAQDDGGGGQRELSTTSDGEAPATSEARHVHAGLRGVVRRVVDHPLGQGAGVLLGWAIPVGFLVIHNWVAMGTLTGYDPTNESIAGRAFTWDHAADNWETMFRHLFSNNGMFLLFPLGLLGLGLMFRFRWRLGLVMAGWILPCLAVYTFYYWAPDSSSNIGYLRFFLTVFPAIALCAVRMVSHLAHLAGEGSRRRSWGVMSVRVVGLLAVGVALAAVLRRYGLDDQFTDLGRGDWTSLWATIVCLAAAGAVIVGILVYREAVLPVMGLAGMAAVGVQIYASTYPLESDHYNRLMLDYNTRRVLAAAPAGSVIFHPDRQLMHNLQFARQYALYDGQTFSYAANQNLKNSPQGQDDPQGFDPGRRMGAYERLKDVKQEELDATQRRIVTDALAAGQRVFVIDAPQQPQRAGSRAWRQLTGLATKWTGGPQQKEIPLYAATVSDWRVMPAPKVDTVRPVELRRPRDGRMAAAAEAVQRAEEAAKTAATEWAQAQAGMVTAGKARTDARAQQGARQQEADRAKAEAGKSPDGAEAVKRAQAALAAANVEVSKADTAEKEAQRALDKARADKQSADRALAQAQQQWANAQRRPWKPRQQRPAVGQVRYAGDWRVVEVRRQPFTTAEQARANDYWQKAAFEQEREREAAVEAARRKAEEDARAEALKRERERRDRLAAEGQALQKATQDRQSAEAAVKQLRVEVTKLLADRQAAEKAQATAQAEQKAAQAGAAKAKVEMKAAEAALAKVVAAQKAAAESAQKATDAAQQAKVATTQAAAELARAQAEKVAAEKAAEEAKGRQTAMEQSAREATAAAEKAKPELAKLMAELEKAKAALEQAKPVPTSAPAGQGE